MLIKLSKNAVKNKISAFVDMSDETLRPVGKERQTRQNSSAGFARISVYEMMVSYRSPAEALCGSVTSFI